MIPRNITRNDVLKAIDEVEKEGIPPGRHSTKWSVLHNDTQYPPKYLISLANKHVNGEEWNPSDFSGGEETNEYLISLGFKIVNASTRAEVFPIQSHAWIVISQTVALRELDKSSFMHKGMNVPSKLRGFFAVEYFKPANKRDLLLHHAEKQYRAQIEMDAYKRTYLFWRSDFSEVLAQKLSGYHDAYSKDEQLPGEPPSMRFEKLKDGDSDYHIELISPAEIDLDVESDFAEEQEPKSEGAVKYYYGKRYERVPANRTKAIEIHGCSCVVCGFDFEECYGERGKGFVEVHHTKPLSSLDKEIKVDPGTDLVPVCANCHRMMHRRRDQVLSLEEMRQITNMALPESLS